MILPPSLQRLQALSWSPSLSRSHSRLIHQRTTPLASFGLAVPPGWRAQFQRRDDTVLTVQGLCRRPPPLELLRMT